MVTSTLARRAQIWLPRFLSPLPLIETLQVDYIDERSRYISTARILEGLTVTGAITGWSVFMTRRSA